MRNTRATTRRRRLTQKRVLVVNCFFDDSRQPVRRRAKIPQALGPVHLAGAFEPGLCEVRLYFNYAETTRYCNFHCSFCALTGEGRAYRKYDLEHVRKQMAGWGRRRHVVFADNNFYGNDRGHFLARLGLIKEVREARRMKYWAALVTGDFFRGEENLKLVHDAGCRLLFSGVEAFDAAWLRRANKPQNTLCPQVEMIRKCLDAGILFCYGLILDVASRSLADLRRELGLITGTPEITLPSFLTRPIPLLGTPFFRECIRARAIPPNTRLRDMDGSTLLLKPLDPVDEVVRFLGDVPTMRGYGARVAKHSSGFIRRYRKTLRKTQPTAELVDAGLLCAYALVTHADDGGGRTGPPVRRRGRRPRRRRGRARQAQTGGRRRNAPARFTDVNVRS